MFGFVTGFCVHVCARPLPRQASRSTKSRKIWTASPRKDIADKHYHRPGRVRQHTAGASARSVLHLRVLPDTLSNHGRKDRQSVNVIKIILLFIVSPAGNWPATHRAVCLDSAQWDDFKFATIQCWTLGVVRCGPKHDRVTICRLFAAVSPLFSFVGLSSTFRALITFKLNKT